MSGGARGQRFEKIGELGIEHLLRGREMERIETGGANKGLGDRASPGVPKIEKPDPGLGVDGSADDLFTVLELGEDCSMEVEIEVEAMRFDLAIGRRGDGGVDQTAHRDLKRPGDPEEERKLIVGIDARHRDHQLLGAAVGCVPHRL